MKKSIFISLIMLFAWGCQQIEPDLTGIGEVKFQSVLVDSFSGNLPNGRIAGPSTWKHVFKNPAVMEIKNKVTGQEYKFDYNPNQFGEGVKFPLPYGSYTYKTKVSGGAFEKFLPFRAEGEFNLGVANLEVKIQATTDYGLITVKNEYVKSIAIKYGSETCEFKLLPDKSFYFIYAKKGQIAKIEIIESLSDKLIKRDVSIAAYNHYNFFLKKAELNGMVNFIELALTVFEYVEEGIEIGVGDPEVSLEIGMQYQGGIIAYILQSGDPGYLENETHGLIAAPSDQSTGIQWYDGSRTTTGATGTALGTGQANTTAIVISQGAGNYAAQLCNDLVLGGYDDWYLPSKDELNKLYLNRAAVGGFASAVYWSSSETGFWSAWQQYLNDDNENIGDGEQYTGNKASTHRVRAVRAF